ncbi:MAG: elongator complex protein 3 [Bacillota bacterium]
MKKKHVIIPIFIPHEGCPHDCVFCNQKRITGNYQETTGKIVEETIQIYLNAIKNRDAVHVEVAFYGGSFTGINIDKQKELLYSASIWKEKGVIQDIRISTRPDYIYPWTTAYLTQYGVTIVELGVQSLSEDVLAASNRGHSVEDVARAMKYLKQSHLQIGIQLMVGLPQDDAAKLNSTTDKVIALSPDFVRIYPALVIKDTYLEYLYESGTYQPLSIAEAVQLCKTMLLKFARHHIPVIRIGLQPTDEMIIGKNIVAGPFHPSFRQLVEASMYYDMISFLLMQYQSIVENVLMIETNDRTLSYVVGQKKENIIRLKNVYQLKKIEIYRNNQLTDGDIMIILNSNDKVCYNINQYVKTIF